MLPGGCRMALLCGLTLICTVPLGSQAAAKPKIRAITAFVRVAPAHYQSQVADALKLLREAKRAYQQQGYEVETIRITTQPFIEIVRGLSEAQAMSFFQDFDKLAKQESFIPNVGPAMLADTDPQGVADLMARVLAANELLNGSIVVAQEDGVHWNAVRSAARVMKYLAEHSAHSAATFRFAATAMLPPYAPFFPGSYHTGAGHQFSVGLESANVVEAVLESAPGDIENAARQLGSELGRYAGECEQIAQDVAKRTGWTYAGLDPTPAPAGKVSIGAAIEKFTGARFGSSGTLTAAATITRAVKSLPVKSVGYGGLMLPVLEDDLLARRWSEGAYTMDSLLAYSAVCGTGLDTVPLPGDVSEEQLARIVGDVASLAYKWKKPLSARLQPAAGRIAGQSTSFGDSRLADAVLQKLP